MKSPRLKLRVQFVANQSRLYTGPLLGFIHFQQLVHVFGEIQNEGVADRLPGQAGAAAPRQERDLVILGNSDGLEYICFIPRENDSYGLNLVNAGVGGVHDQRERIEAQFSLK